MNPRIDENQVPVVLGRRRHLPWLIGISLAIACVVGLVVSRGRSRAAIAPPSEVPVVDGHAVLVPRAFKERTGLAVQPVVEVALSPLVKVSGTVDFDPRHDAAVGTRLKGLVRSIARFEGDDVKKGELLAEIDSPELGSAEASLVMYAAQKKAAEQNYDRERDLEQRGLTTAREVEAALATLEEFRSKFIAARHQVSALAGTAPESQPGPIGIHELRAPLAGTVVERHLSAGQSVEAELTAFRVADLDHLWVELAVFERALDRIALGDAVELAALGGSTETLHGQVSHVGEQIDPATRTGEVRVEVDNRARRLRPGQAVTATIRVSEKGPTKALVVPGSAITFVDGKSTVFVAESENRLVATAVELGESDERNTQVVSGLSPGQSVVTEGVFALKSELYR